jgi:hypothetical protein
LPRLEAQQSLASSSVSGVVLDPGAGVTPDATLRLVNLDTNHEVRALSWLRGKRRATGSAACVWRVAGRVGTMCGVST